MASSSGVQHQQSFQQQQQQQQLKCKQCGLLMNSAESLEVHRQYHEGNLMQQWAIKAQGSNTEEKNNNMTKQPAGIKREFNSNNSLPGDNSSDIQKRSPEYHPTTPENIYGHPPTPQSYQSASSPYQSNDNSAYPQQNFQNFPVIKSEGNSPASQSSSHYPTFSNYSESQQFFPTGMESYPNDIHCSNSKIGQPNIRYNPYSRPHQYYDTSKQSSGAAPPISPSYPPQPTPSPSPKQCDKCGYVCESAAQLIEHNNLSHPNNQPQYNQANHYMFEHPALIKEEEASQSEILDLDSHKVVHPTWAEGGKESDKRLTGEPQSGIPHPHSVSAMLNTWPGSQSAQHQQNGLFQADQNIFLTNEAQEQKMFPHLPNLHQENKIFSGQEQKMFTAHQIDNQNFVNGMSPPNPDLSSVNQQTYRAYDHLSTTSPSNSVVASPQVSQVPSTNSTPVPSGTKSSNWKSNEARRPKTYNCTACNKWFTSSGHLKRHYNTTLHKNAVKSSGQPDPATMPISAHHHPARDSSTSKDDSQRSNSPREDSRGDDSSNGIGSYDTRLASMPGIIQHPPNGPYDRQAIHHTPPMHSPLGQHHSSALGSHMMPSPSFSSLNNGSPPNGDAGLSPESRGLLPSMNPASHTFGMMPQPHMMPMEAAQFQMYPNGLAPHVTQATDITSNLSITGEQQQYVVQMENNQPLPSFEQINRFGGGYANVGGMGPMTVPPSSITYFSSEGFDLNDVSKSLILKQNDGSGYRFSILSNEVVATGEQQIIHQDIPQQQMNRFSPTTVNNNNNIIAFNDLSPENPNASITYLQSPDDGSAMHAGQAPTGDGSGSNLSTEDSQSESKENYEDGNANNDSNTQAAAQNQEDLSKTKCFDCDKVFNRPCYLTQHNKTFHNGDKPFKCTRCGKRFSDEVTYKQHTKKHAGDKPHKCDTCPKMFNHKTDLRRHLCCHTGRKPYACEICGKGFIRKDHMIKHMDTHTRKREKLSAIRS